MNFSTEKEALKDVAAVATGVAVVQNLNAGEKPPFDSEAT